MKYADAISIKIFDVLAIGFRSPKYAIVMTGMPLHTHAPIHCNPHVTLLIVVMGINFHRKAVNRNLSSKRKASLKYPKINSL